MRISELHWQGACSACNCVIFLYLKLNLPGVSYAEQLKSCHFAVQCFQLLIEEMFTVDIFG